MMSLYVNLCPPHTEKSDIISLEVPLNYTDKLLEYAHIISDHTNLSNRKAFKEVVKYSVQYLLDKGDFK